MNSSVLSLGKNIKQARIKANLTQTQLGKSIGKDKAFISHIENDYFIPTLNDLQKICDILKVNPYKMNFPRVATLKTRVATRVNSKTRVDTYQIHIEARRGDFPLLTKNNIKRCNYRGLRDIFKIGYDSFKNQVEFLNKIFINDQPASFKELDKIYTQKLARKIEIYIHYELDTKITRYYTSPILKNTFINEAPATLRDLDKMFYNSKMKIIEVKAEIRNNQIHYTTSKVNKNAG